MSTIDNIFSGLMFWSFAMPNASFIFKPVATSKNEKTLDIYIAIN